MSTPSFSDLQVGTVVAEETRIFTRQTLVSYAGASLDFNPIHYNDDFAKSVGLPGVIAHGMLTMGSAGSVVSDWLGDAGFVDDYQTRFTKPVPVEALEGSTVTIFATVAALEEDANRARIDLKVTFDGATVLGKSQAWVRFTEVADA